MGGFGDRCRSNNRAGCQKLRQAVMSRAVSACVAGHVHEGYGYATDEVTLFVNASTCTHEYQPANRPIVFDLPPPPALRAATGAAAASRASVTSLATEDGETLPC